VGVSGDGDWRLTNLDRYLSGVGLHWRSWSSYRTADSGGDWDHDHCEFCFVHFGDHVFEDDPRTQLEGYTTDDGYHWICEACFDDFKTRFGWVVVTPRR